MRKDGGLFVCAGRGEDFSFAKSIGVGLVESAMGMTRICQKEKPRYIIFMGSAGSYDMKLALLDLYVSDHAVQIEAGFINGTSYTPLQDHTSGVFTKGVSYETSQKNPADEIEIFNTLYSLPCVGVNSSNYITRDEDMARQMHARGIMLENMEFFSVMRVAQEFGISAMGVFCVSNYCNDLAHQDFIKNHDEVKRRLECLFYNLEYS